MRAFSDPSANEILLWLLNGAVGVVMLVVGFMLRAIYAQNRDANDKLTALGESHARLEVGMERNQESIAANATEFKQLDAKVDALTIQVATISGANDVAKRIVEGLTSVLAPQPPAPRRRRSDE